MMDRYTKGLWVARPSPNISSKPQTKRYAYLETHPIMSSVMNQASDILPRREIRSLLMRSRSISSTRGARGSARLMRVLKPSTGFKPFVRWGRR